MVIYRVKNIYTGEIKETNRIKRSYEIAVRDLKDILNESKGYNCGVLLIVKVNYDCNDSEWDGAYWEYPVLSEELVFTVFVSTMSVQVTRVSDSKKCIMWRK